ncbi:rhodanese-like domain-containing protein [Shewanella sp. A32]|uniref:rhodanese-like domain-containing protein n=1 Tax=Shewanella sp. A32 TaxID=3031327 RepID=UPI0023B8F6ED|nr:rhodanese-like domain-containing protein [Shewanella sp. A32]MDF0533335.1 rhodanese-like domain-containing protein [Shewanella sp. A32]
MSQSALSRWSGAVGGNSCWELIKQGAQVLDVRSPDEFAQAHLPQATNVPLNQLDSWIKQQPNKQRPLVLYCAAGIRAQMGCDILRANGFDCAVNGGSLQDLLYNQPAA